MNNTTSLYLPEGHLGAPSALIDINSIPTDCSWQVSADTNKEIEIKHKEPPFNYFPFVQVG